MSVKRTAAIVIALVLVDANLVQAQREDGYPCVKYAVYQTAEGGYFAGNSCEAAPKGDIIALKDCDLADCQRWIKENWIDMRPLSLQRLMKSEGLSVEKTKLRVVINHEEQYSLALADRPAPRGWKDVGRFCTLGDCMDYIEKVWTDMRPRSLRESLTKRR